MRRFFHADPPTSEGVLCLRGAEARHAGQVIRLREGDGAIMLDGRGAERVCVVKAVSRDEVRLTVRETIRHAPPKHRIRLVQAVTKGRSFETVLQKSCELGATEIQPLISERVIARPDEGEQAGKLARWAQVLTEATKQCGAAWLPAILPPRTLEESMSADVEVELRIGAFLHAGARHLRSIMDGFVGDHRRLPRSVSIWVGPEGDFADDEVSRLIGAGVCPLTLGSLVLRSETAAAAALAILGNELSAPRSGLSTGSGPGTIGQVDRGG